MRLSIAASLAAVLVSGCGVPSTGAVDGAWIRLNAVQGRPAAGYFTLRAGARRLDLVSVSTPAARRAELHESMSMAGGAMTMTPVARLAVMPEGRLVLAPGGKHVMLFDVDPALRPGAKTTLTLTFADGATLNAAAKVVAAGDPAP